MSPINKILSKSGAAAIALLVGLSSGIIQVEAQACDPPGAAATAAGGTIVPSIIQNALNVVTGIQNTVGTSCGLGSGLTGGNLISCMQSFFAQHAQTVTNNQMMQSSVMAKHGDYLATNAYALQLQSEQSRQAIANGQGTSASSNSLQHLNNPLCVPATVSTGAAQATVGMNSAVIQQATITRSGGNPNSTGVVANPPSSTEALTPKISSVTRISEFFSAGSKFSSGSGNSTGTSLSVTGSCPDTLDLFGLDTAPDRLLCQMVWSDPNLQSADNAYVNYILGVAPEVPPFTPGAANTPASGQQATVAEREKVAFMSTAQLGFKDEYALRKPFTNAATPSIQAIYNAVGQSLSSINGQTSRAQLLDALFRQPVENPNTFVQISSLGVDSKGIQFLAGEIMLTNYINYENYLVMRKLLDVNSAQLAIAYRDFNFQGHP